MTTKDRRKPITPRLIVVVQSIHVRWTKESRGGQGAVQRNAIPEAVALPLHLCRSFTTNALLHHQCEYDGDCGVSSASDKLAYLPGANVLTVGCVAVTRTVEGVCATYQYEHQHAGLPLRDHFRKQLRLSQGQWGQIVYNGRFVLDRGWLYQKTVVNVGLFDASAIVPSLFIDSEPDARLSKMVLLF